MYFMPFYPITCTEEGEYAALLEIGKIDEWMDKIWNVQEGKLSFLQEINEELNPVCVIVNLDNHKRTLLSSRRAAFSFFNTSKITVC